MAATRSRIVERKLFGPARPTPTPRPPPPSRCRCSGTWTQRFLRVMDETCDMLRTVWRTRNLRTLPHSATGSAGMEAAFVNTVGEGDVVVVGVNGLFGQRKCEVASRCGAQVVPVEHEWGTAVDADRVLSVTSLHAGLARILDEGSENVGARHEEAGRLLQAGLEAMGLELFATELARLPELTTVKVPDGVDSAAVRSTLLERHGIEIGAGAGADASSMWRIGLMGHNARRDAALLVLAALQDVLGTAGRPA